MQPQPHWNRLPHHVGFIPDGNRRWADVNGLRRPEGYPAGIEPGLRLLDVCRKIGIQEVSIYGFTKENVRRAPDQVDAFRNACVDFAVRAVDEGAALLVVGDSDGSSFPEGLRPFIGGRTRGRPRVNLLANYGWLWDLQSALNRARSNGYFAASETPQALASGEIPRVDLVVRWGGHRRLSGFLPFQCAYADMYVLDTLWPDMDPGEFLGALDWYQRQDVTMGG